MVEWCFHWASNTKAVCLNECDTGWFESRDGEILSLDSRLGYTEAEAEEQFASFARRCEGASSEEASALRNIIRRCVYEGLGLRPTSWRGPPRLAG